MLMKVILWAILLGSLVMGYFGYQSGSATNAAIGIGLIILAGFTLFFLLKIFLHLGFVVVKILLFVALIAIIAISGLKGCQYLMGQGRQVNQQQVAEVQSFENEIAGEGMLSRISSFFSLSKKGTQKASVNNDQPTKKRNTRTAPQPTQALPSTVNGTISAVRSGYLVKIDSHFVKLYGIDAPDPKQNCINRRGENYTCGHMSKQMLERLALGKNALCQVVGGDYNGNYIATCRIGSFDVGASMVSAGWAVADRSVTQVYTPYEEKAHKKRIGLWAGKFVAPWQDRANRTRQERSAQKGGKGFWESLFK